MNNSMASFVFLLGLGACAGLLLVSILSILQIGELIDLLLAQLICVSMTLAHIVMSKERKSISFVFGVQALFFITLPAYIQFSLNIFPFHGRPSLDSLYNATAIISFSFSCLMVGMWVGGKTAKPLSQGRAVNFKSMTEWAWIIGLFAVFLGILLGPSFMLSTRLEGNEFAAQANGIHHQIRTFARAGGLVSFCVIVNMALHAPPKIRMQNKRALWLAIPCFLYVFFPPSLPRFQLIGAILGLSVLLLDYSKTKTKLVLLSFTAPILYFVFPAIKLLGSGGGVSDIFSQIGSRGFLEYIVRVDFDMFLWTAETTAYLQHGGEMRYGANFLGFVLFLVPRSIWLGKPESTGAIVSEAMGYHYFNVSSPIWSEAQISFGFIGVLVIMLGIGIVIGRLEKNITNMNSQGGFNSLYLMVAWTAYIMIFFRGSLSGVAPSVGAVFAFFFLLNHLSQKKIVIRGS